MDDAKDKTKQRKKDKNAKAQIVISAMMLTIIVFMEMYLMINIKTPYLECISMAVVALAMVYFLINGIVILSEERESQRREQYENIFRSEKALYIMLKKSFGEFEEQLNLLEENQQITAEEIINAQKAISKISISRSKENTDFIIESNDKILKQLNAAEESQKIVTNLLKEQKAQLTELSSQTDIRLNQLIMAETKAVSSSEPVENLVFTDESVVEQSIPEPAVVEEKPPMPDMSDPNKMMSADDIAALLANMGNEESAPESVEETPVIEEPVIQEPVVQEPAAPAVDMSDPNKMMSPDEIAALIANL